MRRQGRITAAVASVTVLSGLVTGCAPWLAANPQFASDSARNPDGGGATTTAAGGILASLVYARRIAVEGTGRYDPAM